MTRILGHLIMFGLCVAAIRMNSTLGSFVDLPSIVIVVGIVCGGALASFSPSQIATALRDGFSKDSMESERAHQSSAVFFRLSELSIAAGFTGTLLGMVMMLQALDDPAAIGPAMAVALLTVLYGLILSELVFRSAAADILERGNSSGVLPRARRAGAVALPLFTIFATFATLIMSFLPFD